MAGKAPRIPGFCTGRTFGIVEALQLAQSKGGPEFSDPTLSAISKSLMKITFITIRLLPWSGFGTLQAVKHCRRGNSRNPSFHATKPLGLNDLQTRSSQFQDARQPSKPKATSPGSCRRALHGRSARVEALPHLSQSALGTRRRTRRHRHPPASSRCTPWRAESQIGVWVDGVTTARLPACGTAAKRWNSSRTR